MTFNYRCTKTGCRARRTLNKRKEEYRNKEYKICGSCGGDTLSIDKSTKKRNKIRTCYCDGYHFPHSRTGLWCKQSGKEITDKDFEERYGRVSTV